MADIGDFIDRNRESLNIYEKWIHANVEKNVIRVDAKRDDRESDFAHVKH